MDNVPICTSSDWIGHTLMTTTTYLGLDVETTGLNHTTDDLLEVGMVAFDAHLNIIDTCSVLIHPGNLMDAWKRCNPSVQKMHTINGLWKDLRAADPAEHTMGASERRLLDWLDTLEILDAADSRLTLLGKNLAFDREWLVNCMPEVAERVHPYHDLDALPFMLLARQSCGVSKTQLEEDGVATTHRAVDDLIATRDVLVKSLQVASRNLNEFATTAGLDKENDAA